MIAAQEHVLSLVKKGCSPEACNAIANCHDRYCHEKLLPDEVLSYVSFLYASACTNEDCWIFAQTLLHDDSVTELLPPKCVPHANLLIDAAQRNNGSELDTEREHRLAKMFTNVRSFLQQAGCQTLYRWILTIPTREPAHASVWCVFRFVILRVEQVVELLDRQPAPGLAPGATLKEGCLPGTFDPPRLLSAYSFTETGLKYRHKSTYKMDTLPKKEDNPPNPCVKRVPRSATESYLFFIFCPAHGHCWGM